MDSEIRLTLIVRKKTLTVVEQPIELQSPFANDRVSTAAADLPRATMKINRLADLIAQGRVAGKRV
ncbi:MAG: hypothetical protein KGO01_01680, partial [Burkholderiales bacterium]|nr:hypothetical protein [Burkholderiales bacterium]